MTARATNGILKPPVKNMTKQNRREVLGAGFMLLAGTAFSARSQTLADFSQMRPAFWSAANTRSFATKATRESEGNLLASFLTVDIASRVETLALANEMQLFLKMEGVSDYIYSIPQFFDNAPTFGFDEGYLRSMETVAIQISSDGLPIAPASNQVSWEVISASAPPEDSDFKVVVDILLETLGISVGDVSLIVSAIESDEELKSTIDELIAAITTKDWEEVVGLAEIVFKLLVGSAAWQRIKEIGGRKLSWRLGLRAVPIVGWLYCGAAFVVSIKINYPRFSFAR